MWGIAEQLRLELNGQDDLGQNLAESLNLGTVAYYGSTQVVEAGSFPPIQSEFWELCKQTSLAASIPNCCFYAVL